MHQIVLNEEFSLSYPDGFEEISRETLEAMYHDSHGDLWGIEDKERHAKILITWHEANAFLGKLVSTRELCNRAEKVTRQKLKKYGYSCTDFFRTEAGGLEADGFCYEYVKEGTDMAADILVLKHKSEKHRKSVCYHILYYSRKEMDDGNREVLKGILESVEIEPIQAVPLL